MSINRASNITTISGLALLAIACLWGANRTVFSICIVLAIAILVCYYAWMDAGARRARSRIVRREPRTTGDICSQISANTAIPAADVERLWHYIAGFYKVPPDKLRPEDRLFYELRELVSHPSIDIFFDPIFFAMPRASRPDPGNLRTIADLLSYLYAVEQQAQRSADPRKSPPLFGQFALLAAATLLLAGGCTTGVQRRNGTTVIIELTGPIAQAEASPKVLFQERREITTNVEGQKKQRQLSATLSVVDGRTMNCRSSAVSAWSKSLPFVPISDMYTEQEERVTIFCPGYAATTVFLNSVGDSDEGPFAPSVMASSGTYRYSKPLPDVIRQGDKYTARLPIPTLAEFCGAKVDADPHSTQIPAVVEGIAAGRFDRADSRTRSLVWDAIKQQYDAERANFAKQSPGMVGYFDLAWNADHRRIEAWASQ